MSARASPGVEGDFYGSRGYRPGDPLRTLDWKRSARQGELMVRELATPEPPRVAILLDLRAVDTAPAEARQERAISLAASLVARAHAAGFRVGLRVVGALCASFTPHHALAHRDRLLSALGRIDLRPSENPVETRAPTARTLREATVCVSVASGDAESDAGGATLRFTASPGARSPAGGRPPRPTHAPGAAA